MPLPDMHPVESSAVAKIGYDAELEEAFVKYLDGASTPTKASTSS